MAKTPLEGETAPQTIRFTVDQAAFLKERQAETGQNPTFQVRLLVDDHRTFFDLPKLQIDRHVADMKALGLNEMREYIKYLLALRYEAIIQGHVGLSAPPTKKSR
jgi:hypothetical protein